MLGQNIGEAPDFMEGVIERCRRDADDVRFALDAYTLEAAPAESPRIQTLSTANLSNRSAVDTSITSSPRRGNLIRKSRTATRARGRACGCRRGKGVCWLAACQVKAAMEFLHSVTDEGASLAFHLATPSAAALVLATQ